jgi:alkane 1-monooxygenase
MNTQVMATPGTWKDGKRYLWPMGLLVPLLPFAGWLMVTLTGMSLFWWSAPVFFYGGVALLDVLVGTDPSNPPESAIDTLEQDRFYRWCTFLFLPLQYVGFFAAAWLIARGGLAPMDKLGLAISVGLVNGIAIANAHELGHKKETLERWLARVVLAPSFYGHFYIEHNRGHHVRVSTPEDPTSARTDCCDRRRPAAGMSAASPAIAGTATISSPICCCITCSAIPIITPIRRGGIKPCVTSRIRRSCPPATPA